MELDEVMKLFHIYESMHQNPSSNLSKFTISDLYALFPERDFDNNQRTIKWAKDERFPSADKAGVYLICDKDLNVIYIGRSKRLGQRLYGYFSGTDNCKIVHDIDSIVI